MLMSSILRMPIERKQELSTNSIFVNNSFVGIEIEMENVSTSNLVGIPSWRRVAEGSVDGYEIVLRQPFCGDTLYLAIQELNNISSRVNVNTVFSERTSTHIHIDIRDMTYLQLMNFITLSVMFERVLYKYVAPHRSHNHFCWSVTDCQSIISKIERVNTCYLSTRDTLKRCIEETFSANSTKYSGINLSSIPRYGSLEFRMHEGTMHTNSIIRWINILLSIKEYAMSNDRVPSNILETKKSLGISSIFNTVLGRYHGVLSYPNVERDILEGIRSAQDFVYALSSPVSINYNTELPLSNENIFINLLRSVPEDMLKTKARTLLNANNNQSDTPTSL